MSNNNDVIYCEDRHIMHEDDEDFPERVSGNEMDEQRKQQMAYQYLCHLEEAKTWMEACLNDELPPTTELEEALRTGVIMARLGNFFASDVVPVRKIYDRELKRFQARGLHFKHTDNFMYFVRAMEKVGLPKLFYPETTDLYDKKNMPKVIYCIHALSLYLFKLGLAPQMQDLYGKVKFTEEEISAMRKELEKYGIQMPAFSKIGGILESEMPVDEAALHAAIIVINEAIDHGIAKETFEALRNPNAHLTDLDVKNMDEYQDLLYKAKGSKCQTALLRSPGSEDVYDKMLTQAEVQGNIAMANEIVRKKDLDNAVAEINAAVDSGDLNRLLKALLNDRAKLNKVIAENGDWYQQTLSEVKQGKGNVPLTHAEILEGIINANTIGEQFKILETIMKSLNKALEAGNVDECHSLLMKPEALLPTVLNRSAYLYYNELNKEKKKKQQSGHSANLTHGEVTEHIKVLTAIASINQAIEQGNASELWKCLKHESAKLENIEDDAVNRYLEQLVAVKKEKGQDCGQGKDDLNQVELQLCIDYVNTEVSEEHALITAVQAINRTIEEDNPAATLTSLQQDPAKLKNILPENALLYQALLYAEKQEKKKKTDDPSAELWHDEIQRIIDKCNLYAIDARKLAAGVSMINASLESGTEQSTIEALENADVGLRGVTRECQAAYHTRLKETKGKKGQQAGPWLEQKIPQGFLFYYNTATQQTSWAKPADFTNNSGLLTKEEIQTMVSNETAKHGRQVYLQANEPSIVRLQAHWRGYLARKTFNERKQFMTKQLPAIIKIQANLKRWIQHKKYNDRLEVLHNNDDAIIKIQAWTRMHLARSNYKQRKQLYEDNLPAIVKIQAFMRANLAQHDYRVLLNSQDPPIKIVRKFLHLLDQSNVDFEEELELQKLKAQVVTEIRSNQQLEHDLQGMDIKIGLLVRNKITLQDVIIHNKKLSRKDQEDLQTLASSNTKGIRSLSKESQEKLEAYQNLFYLLQTNPVYLAKLIFEMPQSRSTNFMESVILTLYNYASNTREEYLLLKLFETALREEIFSKIDSIQEIVTGNPTVIKMVVGFNRGTRNQGSLRELLQPLVQTVLDDSTLNTSTNPVEIYKNWINQQESETGQATKLPYDVDPEKALEHPEVRSKVEAAISRLTAATDRFLQSITASVDKIPYGIRYLAMTLRTCMAEKFPKAGKDEILRVVGNLIYYRYMNPAIVAPDAFDIVDVTVDKGLSVEQRRNLGSISKLLQDAASNKKFGGESAHLNALNPYLEKAHQKFLKFFMAASSVEQPESKFNIDEYSDVVMLTKPVIYISIREICDTHKLLLDHRNTIAPDMNDPLQELLDDVGDQPDVKELLGNVEVAEGQTEEDALRDQAKTEISLTLSNKFEVPDDDDSDLRALFVRTKHLIVDVIRVQAGDTLTEILETPATEEQEKEHMTWVKQREQQDSKKEEKLRKSASIHGDSNLPVEGIKRKIIRNLRVLENQGLVTTKNNYQDIVNAIARDIRNQRRYRLRRKQELRKLETTLERLKTKATFYEEQMDYYNRYIETCLDNLAGKESIAQRKEKKKQVGFKTAVKYSAQKLAEKGVVLEIEGLPKNQLKNASFEIVPADSGVFEVSAKFMGIPMEKVEIVFQDLLQLQFEGVAVMKMFGKAKVNVNLLIHLLNKKFYGKT